MNEATESLIGWLLNDEGLYNQTLRNVRSSNAQTRMREMLEEIFEAHRAGKAGPHSEYLVRDVGDLCQVDWEEVVNHFQEDE